MLLVPWLLFFYFFLILVLFQAHKGYLHLLREDSITPDEALVETRWKLVKEKILGSGEICKNICRRYGVEVYFRGGSTIRDLLVHPKDKDTILKKSGVIYKYSCGRVDCGEEYIGESGRTFGERYREHMRAPSPIMDHQNITGHEVSLDNFTIVGMEENSIARNIKEAIFIRVNDPSLNRNIGKFQLSHIWDEVLSRSPELHLK